MVYVATVGEPLKAPNGESDARLRVIYANGTESNILRRSLQRALYKDEHGRRVTRESMGPLFGDTLEQHDIESETISVLRSLSEQPEIVVLRDSLHEIGVTGGSVQGRIANAKLKPTYLMAPVEIVATWKLAGGSPVQAGRDLPPAFCGRTASGLDPRSFGNKVQRQEWFVIPLPVIDEAVLRIRDGSITDFVYDPAGAMLKLA